MAEEGLISDTSSCVILIWAGDDGRPRAKKAQEEKVASAEPYCIISTYCVVVIKLSCLSERPKDSLTPLPNFLRHEIWLSKNENNDKAKQTSEIRVSSSLRQHQ